MASRIQFRVNNEEFVIIEQNAIDAGFPSVSQFVKQLALAFPNPLINTTRFSFQELYDEVKKAVEKKIVVVMNNPTANHRFVLRDIVPSWHNIPQLENTLNGIIPKPLRASIGKKFYTEVKNGVFPEIRYTGKVDKYGTAIYEVIKTELGGKNEN